MEENAIQVNGGITMNVDVSVKKIIYVKKTMFEILLHVIVKMGNISKYYGDSAITCDEVIESCNEVIKTIATNFNEKI